MIRQFIIQVIEDIALGFVLCIAGLLILILLLAAINYRGNLPTGRGP
jgi:hypothetical protein